MKRFPGFLLCLVLTAPAYATSIQEDEGKAVTHFEKKRGFALRDGVETRLGLKVLPFVQATLRVPASALVYSKDEVFVYRKRDGFWLAVEVKPIRNKDFIELSGPDFRPKDEIAISGAGLLKVVDLHLNSDGDAGHVH